MTSHHTHELPQCVSNWRPLVEIKPSKAQYSHGEATMKEAENHWQPTHIAYGASGLMHLRI